MGKVDHWAGLVDAVLARPPPRKKKRVSVRVGVKVREIVEICKNNSHSDSESTSENKTNWNACWGSG